MTDTYVADMFGTVMLLTFFTTVTPPLLRQVLYGKLSSEKGFLIVLVTASIIPAITYSTISVLKGLNGGIVLFAVTLGVYLLGLLLVFSKFYYVLWYGVSGFIELVVLMVWRQICYG